jgi:hypothetical protein
MRRDTNRTHLPVALSLAIVVVLVGAALFVPGGQMGAAGAADHSDRKLEAGYEQQPASVGAAICSSPTACVVPFSLLGVSTGDVAGTFVQAGAGSRMADGSLYANSTIVFTGTVTGCGSGTVTMRSTGFNRGDVTSGSIEIIEGSGTEGLVSLTGTGAVISGDVDPATGIGRGLIEYRVKC